MTLYPDIANHDLLERIPLTARTVLDVGCGTGALGAAYRRRNPRARLLGIERSPDAAMIAADRLDSVAAVDVQADPLPFDLPSRLDCITYGDVLEHLADPWPVLARQAEALSRDGTIVICVPNVEHWSFAARLLAGTWDYEETGLFDATHLRWFSLRSMRRGLERLGLALCDVAPRVFEPDRASAFGAALTPSLQRLGIDPKDYAARSAPLQYVWRARREAPARMFVAGTMLAPVGGVSHVRVVYPLKALATDASVRTQVVAPTDLPAEAAADEARIFVLHRPVLSGAQGVAALQHLLRSGWLVVTEFDDHPDFFPALREPDQFAFAGVHAVQTSTPALAEILRARNPEVAVFPNAVECLPEPRNFRTRGQLTLFFGALNRERDWAPLMPALNAVAAAVGERLHFTVVHDRGFFDALETPHKQFTPMCEHEAYMRLLGESEISFMPLSDTPFNRAKSDLKFIEAAACRVAPLAGEIVYAASIEDGRTGLLFRDAELLRDRLLRLVAMPELARAIAEAARAEIAANRMLAYQVAPRLAWYRSLWSRREELNLALAARIAGTPLATALGGSPAHAREPAGVG